MLLEPLLGLQVFKDIWEEKRAASMPFDYRASRKSHFYLSGGGRYHQVHILHTEVGKCQGCTKPTNIPTAPKQNRQNPLE